MELKKCPICGMPNEKSNDKCTECGHKFVAYFDEDTKKEVYNKEASEYSLKRKKEKELYEKREFTSFKHLLLYYVLNILLLLFLFKMEKIWRVKLDVVSNSVIDFFSNLGFNMTSISAHLQATQFVLLVIITQLLYNILLFFRIEIKKILIWYNLLVIAGLAIYVITSYLLK